MKEWLAWTILRIKSTLIAMVWLDYKTRLMYALGYTLVF